MLRPFFWKDPESGNLDDYEIDLTTPKFPGTTPGTGQLYLLEFYPHLANGVISIPDVKKVVLYSGMSTYHMKLIENITVMVIHWCCIMVLLLCQLQILILY